MDLRYIDIDEEELEYLSHFDSTFEQFLDDGFKKVLTKVRAWTGEESLAKNFMWIIDHVDNLDLEHWGSWRMYQKTQAIPRLQLKHFQELTPEELRDFASLAEIAVHYFKK